MADEMLTNRELGLEEKSDSNPNQTQLSKSEFTL